jgi:hypothetical protein
MAKRTRPEDEPQGFPEFWALWRPHKRPTCCKGDARETYRKCMAGGHDPEDIVLGAAWFIRSFKDFTYFPMAATWLNRGGFEDNCDFERDRIAKLAAIQPTRPDNVVQMSRPSEAERAAHVAKLTGRAG